MLKQERHNLIMKEINFHNKVISTDLTALLKVSNDTIRRDLKELADNEQILKIHGGAISKPLITFSKENNQVYAQEAKQHIAEKTIKLFTDNMVIIIGGGTTMIEVAEKIPDNLKATFYTISPQVAITLAKHENLEVITIGGRLEKSSNSHTGASVINQLSEIKADLGVMGSNAFSMQYGLSDMDWETVQVKKAILRSSKKVAVLSIFEKLNISQRIKICNIDNVDYLITELKPDVAILSSYHKSNLVLL